MAFQVCESSATNNVYVAWNLVVVIVGTPQRTETFSGEQSFAQRNQCGLIQLRLGPVLESSDLLVVVGNTQKHGRITIVGRKYGEQVIGF
jgi:hypothetical protein